MLGTVQAKGIHEGEVGGVGPSKGGVNGAGSRLGQGRDVTVIIEGGMDSQGEEFESK